MYHSLITKYFEEQKPFKYSHPMRLEKVNWIIFGIDNQFDAAEIHTQIEHGVGKPTPWKQPISLNKLLEILQNQE